MSDIAVTSFGPGQEEIIAQIHNAAFEEWATKVGRVYEYRQVAPEDVIGWGTDLTEELWLAYTDGVPAGYIHCRIEEPEGNPGFLHVSYEITAPDMGQSRVGVVPEHRRIGVATSLLLVTLGYARSRGAEIANVYAYSDNHAASALLSGLGFTHEERFYYSRYSGEEPYAFDSVFAELDLRRPLKASRLNPEVTMRPPREDDLEVMVRVFGECSPWVYGPEPPPDQVLAWLRDPWGEVTLVAEYQGEPVGAMEFSDTGRLGVPGVLPEYRNQGIGTTLFYRLLQEMQRKGHNKAVADTGIVLQDAIRMYHRLGFHIARRLWHWVRLL